jgi:hypothetical protein
MSISLHAATIPSYLQVLGAVRALVGKAEAFCLEAGLPAEELIQARLAPDMLPFAYQIKSAAVHSIGAIDGARKGLFKPDRSTPPETFAALDARIAETMTALEAVTPAELDRLVGSHVVFEMGANSMPFTVENFLLSFSQPNFYFHATTAYDILRWKGVQIGKRDFIGRLRLAPKS